MSMSRSPRPLRHRKPGPLFRSDRIAAIGITPFLHVHRIERYQLANGLKVLLIRDPAAPVISYQTWFNVGARHEREGITGIAHLFEHLMFKETTRMPEGAFSRVLEEAGARDLNAWTWYDETVYTQSVPKQYLELVMQLESDRMVNLILNDRQLASEREVVINERRFRSEDDPYGRINEALGALAFDVHPYRWPVIGWRRDIEAITLEDCLTFYRSFYAPNNATLILAGDLESEPTLELIEKYYGSLSAQPIQRPEIPVEPQQTGMRRQSLELPIEAEILELGIKIPGLVHADRPALTVLDLALFQGKASRLERKLVDGEIASSVSSMLPPFVDPGLYEIQVNLREGRRLEEAEAIVFAELEKVAREGLSAAELERARSKYKVGTFQELRDNGSRANFLGIHEVAAGSFEHGLWFLEALEKVTVEDVQRVARTWLRPEAASIIAARPAAEGALAGEALEELDPDLEALEELTAGAGEEAEPFLAAVTPATGVPGAHPLAVDPLTEELMLEAIDQAHPHEASAGQLELAGADLAPVIPATPWPIRTTPLARQATLYTIEDHSLPLVSIQLLIPGGVALEPGDREGLADLMGEMLLRGTRHHSREAFEEALDDLGASLEVTAGVDYFVVAASALAENWDRLTALLREALLEPSFEPIEIERLKGETLAALQEARNDDKSVVDYWFARLLFPGHPYGRSALGTTKSIQAVTRDDVVSLYQRTLRQPGIRVGVAGDISLEAARPTVEALLAALPGAAPETPDLALPPQPPGRRLFLIDKTERTQTQIVLGHPGIRASDPDYGPLMLGTMAFGGSAFTTRLMREVREKRGWSYGAYARLEPHRAGGSFTIWVFPAMGDAVNCLKLVLELYDQVHAAGITEEELEYARKSLLNGAAFDEDTPERCLRGVINRGWLGTDRRKTLEVIASASLEQVNDAIRRRYRPQDLLISMVCTAGKLEPELQNLPGIAEVSVIPYDLE